MKKLKTLVETWVVDGSKLTEKYWYFEGGSKIIGVPEILGYEAKDYKVGTQLEITKEITGRIQNDKS